MVKKLLVCFLFVFQLVLSAQTVYVKAGKNYTDFKYIKSDGTQSLGIQKGVGDSFELGYNYTLFDYESPMSYEFGVTLNEYNAFVGLESKYITWDTYYVGTTGSFLYSFVNQERYSIGMRLGASASKIVYGKEEIDGIFYDIKSSDDFKRILFQYVIGVDAKYDVTDQISIGLGYSIINSLNSSKSSTNKFFINTNQINVGLYFDI